MQTQINNLFGLTGAEEQIGSAAASQQSSQNLAESNLLASLPSFFNSQSAQQEAIAQAQEMEKQGMEFSDQPIPEPADIAEQNS